MRNITNQIVYSLLISISLTGIFAILFVSPIPQDPSYHLFADERKILGIHNFYNVVSNLIFLLSAAYGLMVVGTHRFRQTASSQLPYLCFFLAVAAVAFGSAYYHLNPNHYGLLWDRLPMSIAFMALFCIIISEYLSSRTGKILLLPMIFFGVTSVLYWYMSEINDNGDLRAYILVQFLPLILIPIVLILKQGKFANAWGYWTLTLFYVFAKFCEIYDEAIFQLLPISGHSVKHVLSALGIAILATYYRGHYPRRFAKS